MDFDSPDVEKDFPGLYASESGGGGRKKDDDDFSEGDHEKISKKELLLGRRKDKKDKKDRGYAALDGESSPEEDLETKSPSKSTKKSKAFKFPTKSKEKREKSRDAKDRDSVGGAAGVAVAEQLPAKETKKKDKKEKDKKEKVKDKDKDKKDKKSKQSSVSEEILELGDAQPIFGVSLGLAVERSRCHDHINLPLVVRDCIDFLQEHGLNSELIYKVDAVKARVQCLKRNYNNRESTGTDDFDVPTACSLLKLFFKEMPEPLLTTDLSMRFEEAASQPAVTQQETELLALIPHLPSYNQTLLAWTIKHFDAVLQHEKLNKMNAQSLAMLLSPALQMSHRLLVCILCHCGSLFEDTVLHKYVPPITATSPNLPETADEIAQELKKQDSLLNQIHAEMNAGYVTKKREEQLWEVQRIITQLKRKLRTFEKKPDAATTQKSIDDTVDCAEASTDLSVGKAKSSCSDDESLKAVTSALSTASNTETKTSPQQTPEVEDRFKDHFTSAVSMDDAATALPAPPPMPHHHNSDNIYVHESGLFMLPESHAEFVQLLRLQLINIELAQWKLQLQARINAERSDIVRLKEVLRAADGETATSPRMLRKVCAATIDEAAATDRTVAHYLRTNSALEHKRTALVRQVFEENVELIHLQVDLAIQNFTV